MILVAGLDRKASGDPRADLTADTRRWDALLLSAFDAHPQPHALYGALNGMRCLGASLREGRIEPPSGLEPYDAQEYLKLRLILAEHADWVRDALKTQVQVLEPQPARPDHAAATDTLTIVGYADGGLAGPNDGTSFMTVGWVICGEDGNTVLTRGGHVIEEAGSNNRAEYEALLQLLRAARGFGADRLHVRMDSQLVINQMRNVYKTHDEGLSSLQVKARALTALFEGVTFTQVDRARNAVADNEGRKALKAWRQRQRSQG